MGKKVRDGKMERQMRSGRDREGEERREESGGERKALLDTCARKGRMKGVRETKREMKKKNSQEDMGTGRRGKGKREQEKER